MLGSVRPRMTVWLRRTAQCVPKATDKRSEYVMLIAFPRQKWLHELASMLRDTCIACFVYLHAETPFRFFSLKTKYI